MDIEVKKLIEKHKEDKNLSSEKEYIEAGLDWTGVELEGWNLSGLILSDSKKPANFRGAQLKGANLFRVELVYANLIDVDMTDAILRESRLEDADLRYSTLIRADFGKSDLTSVHLEEANLVDANLEDSVLIDANMQSTNLVRSNLKKTNLKGAKLANAIIRVANLEGADLRHANLTSADLKGANLRKADLRKADFSYANLEGAKLYDADLRGTVLNNTKPKKDRIIDASLSEKKITKITTIDEANEKIRDAHYNLSKVDTKILLVEVLLKFAPIAILSLLSTTLIIYPAFSSPSASLVLYPIIVIIIFVGLSYFLYKYRIRYITYKYNLEDDINSYKERIKELKTEEIEVGTALGRDDNR